MPLPPQTNSLTSSGRRIAWQRWMGRVSTSRNACVAVFRLASLCLVLYWLLIFLATHLPSSTLPKFGAADKLYHALAFAGLAFLLAWALPNRGRQLPLAAMIAVSYGCVDEFTQQFIPGRHCDIRDFAADAVGVLVGLTGYLIARQLLLQQGWGRRLIEGLSR